MPACRCPSTSSSTSPSTSSRTTTGGPAITSPGRSVVRCPASASASAQENAAGAPSAAPLARAQPAGERGRGRSRRASRRPARARSRSRTASRRAARRGRATRPSPSCRRSRPPAPITTAIRARAERRVPETGTFGPTTAVAFAKRNEPPSSKSRTVGGYCTGTSRVTSASGYSACSRAPPPPRKNDCSVCAAR